MTTDTLTVSIPLDDTVTYTSSERMRIGSSGTVTIGTSSPTYNGATITLDDIDVCIDTKRKNLRDEGELPIDIWAKLYNNGVIDDE